MDNNDTGIFGFLAILLILFRPLIYLKDKALSLFSITFSISILTESYLFVIKGILLFIIMLSFFILKTSLPSWERNKKINL